MLTPWDIVHIRHAFVTPNAVRSWRWRYRVRLDSGKIREREVVLGRWPAMDLTDARHARDRQYELLRKGSDPATAARHADNGARDDKLNAARRAKRAAALEMRKPSKKIGPAIMAPDRV